MAAAAWGPGGEAWAGGRRASGRKAAGGVVWAAGPGVGGRLERGGGEGDRAIAAAEQPAAAAGEVKRLEGGRIS